MLKSVGNLENYSCGNVEFLEEAWTNHGLGLALSTKTYIQSEGYLPEVDAFSYAEKMSLLSMDQ
jgi:hypothetical protein